MRRINQIFFFWKTKHKYFFSTEFFVFCLTPGINENARTKFCFQSAWKWTMGKKTKNSLNFSQSFNILRYIFLLFFFLNFFPLLDRRICFSQTALSPPTQNTTLLNTFYRFFFFLVSWNKFPFCFPLVPALCQMFKCLKSTEKRWTQNPCNINRATYYML